MAHNFVKQSDGSKMCSKCGDEIGVSIERDCPRPVARLKKSREKSVSLLVVGSYAFFKLFLLLEISERKGYYN